MEAGEGADEHGLPLVGEHHHRELLLRTVPAQRGAELLPRPALAYVFRREKSYGKGMLNLVLVKRINDINRTTVNVRLSRSTAIAVFLVKC